MKKLREGCQIIKVLNICLVSKMGKKVNLCLTSPCKEGIENEIKVVLKMCTTLRCAIRSFNARKAYITRWRKTLILLSFHGIYYRHREEPMEVEKQRDREFIEKLKAFFTIVRHNGRKVLNHYWCTYAYLTELQLKVCPEECNSSLSGKPMTVKLFSKTFFSSGIINIYPLKSWPLYKLELSSVAQILDHPHFMGFSFLSKTEWM